MSVIALVATTAIAPSLALAKPGSRLRPAVQSRLGVVATESPAAGRVGLAVLRGGGNIRGGEQRMAAGGNAFNAAVGLARLGVATRFLGRTSQVAMDFAARHLQSVPLDFSLVRLDGSTSMTASLEFGPERSNVMFNDPGALEGLQASDLLGEAKSAVSSADAVVVANWAGNRAGGTAFAAEVLGWAKQGGATTFLDPSDVWDRDQDVLTMLRSVAKTPLLDWLLVNEPELREVARVYLLNETNESPCSHDDFAGQGRELSKHLRSGVASHRRQGAQSHRAGKEEAALGFTPIEPQRMTGAGDAWNAGFVAGALLGLTPQERLELAHAVARVFVGARSGPPPGLAEVREFLSSTSQ